MVIRAIMEDSMLNVLEGMIEFAVMRTPLPTILVNVLIFAAGTEME